MSDMRYDFSNEQSEITPKLLYIANSKYGDDWHSTKHSHSFVEIFFVYKGKGRVWIEDNIIDIKEYDGVVINPNIEHAEFSSPTGMMEYAIFAVGNVSFDIDRYLIHNFSTFNNEISTLLKMALNELEKSDSYTEFVCRGLLNAIIGGILRNTNTKITSIDSSIKISKESASVKRYIDANFKNNMTLEDLSQVAHINKFYLIHSFKRDFGLSPINYLIDKRVAESRYLLKVTNYSLSQISNIVGFSSPSYFSQTFKRLMGKTPNEFRRGL